VTAHRGFMRLGVAAALVDGVIIPGDVELAGDRVAGVGLQPHGAGLAVPGFVDLQVNGVGGVDFLRADDDGYRVAGRALVSTGVTAYQPTLISAPSHETFAALSALSNLTSDPGDPRVLPAHLEGPFLSVERRGAHDARHLVTPSTTLAEAFCSSGGVGMMTIAPELDDAVALIEHVTARGVVVSLGHSNAVAAEAIAGFNAGATAVTHVFNAMRPLSAREPGLAGVALTRSGVTVMAIIDGLHLARETVALLIAATRGRLCLVSDSIAAGQMGDGEYTLGGQSVIVTGSQARLADGTLAGSVLTMDAAVRNLVAAGMAIEQAVDAATSVPARVLGDREIGRLGVGGRADLVVLDESLEVQRTLIAGVDAYSV
jgi:N-acetylglucosamine-6-phosphate deacetylase